MSELLNQRIDSLGEFLAHALELEVESADRYRELGESMQVHNNLEVAEFFFKLAGYGDEHAREVQQRAGSQELPEIAPWDYKWSCPESPESPCMDEVNYLMDKCQALELALHNEIRGRDFYAEVARTATDPKVREAAAQMAAEEDTHVEMLQRWISHEACDRVDPMSDLDPPNMPE
jgi:rubrerythrin